MRCPLFTVVATTAVFTSIGATGCSIAPRCGSPAPLTPSVVVTSFRADGYRMARYGSDCGAGVVVELDNYGRTSPGSRAEHQIDDRQGGVLCDVHVRPAPYERDEPGTLHLAKVSHGTEVAMDNLDCTLYPGRHAKEQLAMVVAAFDDLRRDGGRRAAGRPTR